MKSIFHTAVVFEWNQVFCVELEFQNGNYILNSIGSYTSSINTDDVDTLLKSSDSKKIISNELSKFLSTIKCKSNHISFGLNSSMMFAESLPFEPTLNREERIDHVTWELYQHFHHEESVSYASDVFITEENNNLPFQQTITVSIRQDAISFFDDVAKCCGKELHILNVDHFGAEQSFLHNYLEDIPKSVIILNCDEETTDISILINGTSKYSASISIKDDIISRINELIIKNKISKIFIHGRGMSAQFHELLVSKVSIEVQLLDPFKSIKISKQFSSQLERIEQRHPFTSVIGLALRLPS